VTSLAGAQKENKSLFSLLLEIESRMRAETRNEKIDQLFKRSKKKRAPVSVFESGPSLSLLRVIV
jgi:hypothetical protein